jgi:hypothetical protein
MRDKPTSATSEASQLADRRSKLLVHRVFGAGIGAELLAEWHRQYVEPSTFNADALVMARNAASKDFVTRISSIIREVSAWT